MAELAPESIPLLPAEEHERRLRRKCAKVPQLWTLLDSVKDPEIPVVSIWELGILQDIQQASAGRVLVTITPTYSGCPALDVIADDIISTLHAAGFTDAEVVKQLAPAWSSRWMLPSARAALRESGITPPLVTDAATAIACPRCDSVNTIAISEFGATACKAMHKCLSCFEPFEYFKAI